MAYDTGLSMEERVTSLFQPDTLLPEQYMERFRRKLHLEPEKKLMLAVLEDAINCFKENVSAENGNKKMLFNEAEDWILDTSTDWIFSFENICDVFELNPQYVRRALLNWKQQHMALPSSANVWQERQVGL